MRMFGRILGGLGLGLICIGSVGSLGLLPPPVLDEAIGYLQERRLALRAFLPDLPELQNLLAGTPQQDCTGQPQVARLAGGAPPAADCDTGESRASLLRRSDGAAARFRAPAAAAESAAD